jgi:hypothetical protein
VVRETAQSVSHSEDAVAAVVVREVIVRVVTVVVMPERARRVVPQENSLHHCKSPKPLEYAIALLTYF